MAAGKAGYRQVCLQRRISRGIKTVERNANPSATNQLIRATTLATMAPADSGSTYANAKNPANITFRMAASPRSFAIAKLRTLCVALFSPYVCEPMWSGQANGATQLEVRASTLQESPDTVICAGHWEQQHQTLGM